MNLLQVTKIARNGRISLGENTIRQLRAREGDHVQIFADGNGRILIAKVVPPEVREG